MDTVDLQIVGGGKMGWALASGLLTGAPTGRTIRIVEPFAERADELRGVLTTRFDGAPVTVGDATGPAAGTVLAVKPHLVTDVVAGLAGSAGRLLSIAAGVTIASIEGAAPAGTVVVRAMPNTPALVGAGVTAIAAGTACGDDDLAWASEILSAVGQVVTVPEHLLDAVTGLSGSGPAYVFLVLESLIEGGVAAGLPRAQAETLATNTLLGAARLALESDASPAQLRADVTSPGGTTAAGLHALEAHGVRAAFIDAVLAARDRAAELG